MVAVIVAAHGHLAEGLIASSAMIAGPQEDLVAVTFDPSEGPDDLLAKYAAAVEKSSSEHYLILVDLLGGSPYNAAARFAAQREDADVVTGVNLPMLIEVLGRRMIGGTLPELVETARTAKAGNVNNALSVAKAEFFVIFDADFVAKPDFLYETLPFMEDPNVAFVQTPQVYGNLNNIVSRGAGFIQMVFYRFIQPGRNEFNAAFCVGTNVLFRRAAVKDIGGIYTQSKSEDIWTSILLHERGWRSIFQPKELAIGETPDTIESYSKQQLRWATGGFEILLTHNPLRPRRRLHMDQRLMYFATCTFYFTGIAPGLLMLVPVLEVFFDLRPVTLAVKWYEWALFYPGFYAMQILLAAVIAGTFRWEVLLLAANSFPIYIKAFFNALLKVDTKWSVTGATGGKASAFNFIMVQVWAFVLMVATSIVSIYRDYSMGHLNIATFWCVLNSFFLGAFVVTAFLENRQKKREKTQPQRGLEAAESPYADRQLVSVGRQSEALDIEAILDAQAAKGALAENPELQDRKG